MRYTDVVISRVPINVECYAGGRAAETPRAVHLAGERFAVADIVDRWYEGGVDPTVPRAEYFKVRTDQDAVFVIRYEPESHAWYLVSELR